jgi:phosphoadenosine phosphosulfate reductase
MSFENRLATTRALLDEIARDYPGAVLANSLGAEDMVLTDLIARAGLPISIFSLDTGRLPEETLELLQRAQVRYPELRFQVYYPDHAALEAFVAARGINAFYQSVELRKSCCEVRKIEPLRRALAGRPAWLTGLRRQQSPTREGLGDRAFDNDNGLMKFNPLIEWSEQDVWDYIRAGDVPYNVLHDRHYPSIGCAPCTRAIAVGEDLRAGRWWWENPESKECGLHVSRLDAPAAQGSKHVSI